ncbi:MAG: hypothetical protein Fur006_40640 [Coleofasciculaceae cyanobacterium]
MVLLDTNHCSYAILGNTQVLDRLANLGDEPITTCTIVKGELIDMAARSQQRHLYLMSMRNAICDMEFLLDTHALLWYLLGDPNLGSKAKEAIDAKKL